MELSKMRSQGRGKIVNILAGKKRFRKEYQKEYYLNSIKSNKDKVDKRRKQYDGWEEKNNRKVWRRLYYLANKERFKKYANKYYIKRKLKLTDKEFEKHMSNLINKIIKEEMKKNGKKK